MAKKSTTPEAIFAELRKIAPNIAFSVRHEEDPNYRWDGDGPDPAEEGYVAYGVDVTARAIIDGEIREGSASLGGTYNKPDEIDPDISGYLPQMLEEALEELRRQPRTTAYHLHGSLHDEADAAKKYLRGVMRLRHEEQRRGR